MSKRKTKQQTNEELRADIVHMSNTLLCLARDGKYASPEFEKLYEKCSSAIAKLAGVEAKKAEPAPVAAPAWEALI